MPAPLTGMFTHCSDPVSIGPAWLSGFHGYSRFRWQFEEFEPPSTGKAATDTQPFNL